MTLTWDLSFPIDKAGLDRGYGGRRALSHGVAALALADDSGVTATHESEQAAETVSLD